MHKQHQRVSVNLKRFALTVCALMLLSVSALAQQPFTYQGFLRVNGLPANGEFDFRFRLFDSATGTNQVGTTVIADDKQVRQGFYTVVLDFGNVWTGGQRWLEIAIRPGNSTGSYTTLSPRVQLTPVPLAHQAFSVPWSGVTGFTIASPLTGTGTSGNPLRLINGTSAGQILKWNGTQWALATDNDTTYSAGAGLSLSGTTFSIASGGVTTGMLADGAVTSAKLSTTGVTAGTYGSATQVGVFTVDAQGRITSASNVTISGVSPGGAAGGDLSGSYPNPTVARLQGRSVSTTAPSTGQVLKWDGSAWTPSPDNDTTYSAGAGLSLSGTTFSIASGGVTTGMLADNAVTNSKIADGAVTDPKIVSVSWSKITGAPSFLTGITAQNPLTGAGTSSDPLRLISGTSAGQILKWNGTQWALATDNDTTYSAGAGLSLSGTTFSIASGGVTTGMLADGAVTSAKLSTTGVTAGTYGSATQVGVFTVDAQGRITSASNVTISGVSPGGAAGGDLSGSYPNPTVARLQGRAVATTAPSTGQVLKWDGSAWAPGDDLRDQFWRQGPSGTIYFDGTVGIGTSVPFTGVKLDVRGRINLSYNSGSRPHLKLAEIDDPEDYARLEFVNPTGDAANRVWQIRARQIANQANEDLEVWNTARGWVLNCEGDGDVRVLATLRAAAKNFLVDHPLDPENYYLIHHCPESAEPHVYYSGTVVLDAAGEAWVQLPHYFEAIARDPRYTLTPVGAPMPNLHVAVEIQGNRFKIAGGVPGKRVSWRVEAIRNDPYMRYHGYQDEVPKPEEERGTYLHPELYGQPMERSVGLRGEK
jgi:hypothetical protein